MPDDVITRLDQIQEQLSMLQTSYGNLNRTYYNMFYNSTPMDITLQIYNEDGSLETITVPNRAKNSIRCSTYTGSPEGNVIGTTGTLCIDTISKQLYYKTTNSGAYGWICMYTEANLVEGKTFLAPNGSGSLLEDIDAEKITLNQLAVLNGGTGCSSLQGILKGNGTDPVTTAVAGEDFLAPADFSGMVVYVLTPTPPAGFLACDGSMISKATYARLFEQIGTTFGEDEDGTHFALPNLDGLFIRCWTGGNTGIDTQEGREWASIQQDCIPNILATWAQEVTGAEASFSGSVRIARDEDNNYVQVDGKTSAPAGSYDYLIEFDASLSSDKYQDVDEVRVKNIALLPVIKY